MKAKRGDRAEKSEKIKGLTSKFLFCVVSIVVQIEERDKSEFKIDFELIKVIIFKNLCSVFLILSWNL